MGPRFLGIGILRTAAADRTAFSGGARASGSGDFKAALADAASRGSELKKIANRKSNEPDRADDSNKPDDRETAPADTGNNRTDRDTAPVEVATAPIQIVSVTNGENAAAAAEGKSPSPIVDIANKPVNGEANGDSQKSAAGDSGRSGQSTSASSPEIENSIETAAPDVTAAETAAKLNVAGQLQPENIDESKQEIADAQSRDGYKTDVGASHPSGKGKSIHGVTLAAQTAADVQPLDANGTKLLNSATNDDASDASQIPIDETEPSSKSVVLQEQAQEQPSDTANVGETAFQEKVRRWIDGRRESGDVKPAVRPELNIASSIEKVKPQSVGVRKSGSKFDAAVEATGKIGKVKVAAGRGDGAAASVARLLVQGLAQQETSDKNPMTETRNAPVQSIHRSNEAGSANGGNVTPTTAASPANIVADLLAATDESKTAVENIAKALSTSGGSGRYQATMRLDPPELGHVKVQIRMQAEAMTLQVQAENNQVSKLIESRLGELREALASHGIRIDKAEVTVKTPDSGESQNQSQQERSLHDGQRGQGEHSRSDLQEGGWSQGGWRETRDGSSRENGTPTWTPGNLTGGIDTGSAGETSTDRWMPILDGSVDLVA